MEAIERLQAIEGIRLTKAHYELAVLNCDWDRYASLFTEDCVWDESGAFIARNPVTGEWDSTGCEVPFAVLEELEGRRAPWPRHGRAAILETLRSKPAPALYHELFNPEIEILDRDTARAVWPFKDIIHFPEGAPLASVHGWGHYHERYAREGDRWLISELRLTRRFLYAYQW
ncbi:nuclear transport factor 2 family protein [Nocardia rhamnosiphila]